MIDEMPTLTFDRQRVLVWVCDLESSTRALNDATRVDHAEEYLKRFYWLSSRLLDNSDATVKKWTGDGFLAAFEVPLDRELGRTANKVFDMAWQLTLLCNVTKLGVPTNVAFSLRHGIACDPDAILVKTQVGGDQVDVIGRGVVLASRLSGMDAPFPRITSERQLARAAAEISQRHKFVRRLLRKDEVLKYFKGEARGTREVVQSARHRPRRSTLNSLERTAKAAIKKAEAPGAPPPDWLVAFVGELQAGPAWARQVHDTHLAYLRDEVLGSVKAIIARIEKTKADAEVGTVKQ